ncbi:hypothetical protein Tsubulata_020699 [Turnera subulata]|uniref:Uncharacterized protein n=1 Tax=Turnera subulata TaxID=218843 RepID=A0A9Q0FV49_9ROSI|nr:hypothetical protein Tsubulata_020699 [Turnera subulata]
MTMAEQQAANPPPPPTQQRRPRVREVSSRFMSPVTSSSSFSSSSSPLPRHHHHHHELEEAAGEDRKPQQRKLFKDKVRPDTPTATRSSRSSSSMMRQYHRSTPNLNHHLSAATKLLLLQSSTDREDHDDDNDSNAENDNPHHHHHSVSGSGSVSAPSSPHLIRSSMPEASARFLAERSVNRLNSAPSSSSSSSSDTPKFSRSLNFHRSSTVDNSFFHSIKPPEKQLLLKHQTQTPAAPPPPLPPVPLTHVPRKTKKSPAHAHQLDSHSLRMLHNRYLQWRFVNAKSQASIQSQTTLTQRTLYSLALNITQLYESVISKRIQLGLLRRTSSLSTILEAQMPYLDQWCALELDYSTSLSEAIQALMNVSHQVPVSGNIRIDISELGEALNSAITLMEATIFHFQSLIPKAEQTENVISKLAKVTAGERSFIEECGDLLSTTYKSQVVECSLSAQLIQLHQT